jgi:hypothetical protein
MVKKKNRRNTNRRMHSHPPAENLPLPSIKSQDDDRRSHRREETVLSRIEDITYKVLRQHEPKKP